MMKNKLEAVKILLIMGFAFFMFIFGCSRINAQDNLNANYFSNPQIISCSAYTSTGLTDTNTPVREGIAAGKEECLGMCALLYAVEDDGSMGDFIGYYEFKDVSENGALNIWMPDETATNEWVNTYGDSVYMQIVDGRG